MRLAHKHVIARDVQLVIDLDKLGKALDFMHSARRVLRRHVFIKFLQKQTHAHRVHPRRDVIFLHQQLARQFTIVIAQAKRLRQ